MLDKIARLTGPENELLQFVRAIKLEPYTVRNILMQYLLQQEEPGQQQQQLEPEQLDQQPESKQVPKQEELKLPETNKTCPRCKSNTNIIKKPGRYYGLYCKDCGRWLRWIKEGAVDAHKDCIKDESGLKNVKDNKKPERGAKEVD